MARTKGPEPLGRRTLIGRFSRYKDAKRTVDQLRVARIPQHRITVLGRGMTWSPPLTAERSARLGAWLGSSAGAATMLLLWTLGSLAAGFSWLGALLAGALVGAAVGSLIGLAVWRMTRDRGVVPETGTVDVERYEVLVEPDDEPKARETLER